VRLRWAGVTDTGRVRRANEDNILLADPLFVVADGMGGHAAGEVASRIAVDILQVAFGPDHAPTVEGIVAAVRQANRDIVRQSLDTPELRGMGTTVTGLAIVGTGDDERVAVFNVGDSRTYRLRAGRLDRVTTDHSYVQELVELGEITPAEARVHPHRNIVTRALGVDADVDVDVVEEPPVAGDRYVICSDGLVDELDDPEIERIVTTAVEPQAAADELVRRANASGGRDNISVVVVDLVEVGAATAVSPGDDAPETGQVEAVASGAETAEAVSGEVGSADPSGATAVQSDAAAQGPAEPVGGWIDEQEPLDTSPTPPAISPEEPTTEPATDRPAKRRRRPALATVVIGLAVLAVLAVAVAAIGWHGRRAYFVAFNGDQVVVYQGRPGGVLWLDPTLAEVYPLQRGELTEVGITSIEDSQTFSSRTGALDFLGNLEQNPAAIIPTTTTSPTTTATTTTTTTTTTTLPPVPPTPAPTPPAG
jgi:protein phosphatase